MKHLKQFLCFFLIALTLWPGLFVYAEDLPTASPSGNPILENGSLLPMPSSWPAPPEISAHAALLMDAKTGQILYHKNATDPLPPASTTKLMTALLTLENAHLTDTVVFTKYAINRLTPGSSHIGMKPDEHLSVRDALYGLLLPSANECAYALAEHVSGTISAFVKKMNQRAKELGCISTDFKNPSGLTAKGHVSSAYDLALILRALLKHPEFLKNSSTPAYVKKKDDLLPRDIPMGTTNAMLKKSSPFYDERVKGGKTGWTPEAGRCLITYSESGGRGLIVSILGDANDIQYKDTKALLDYGFSSFSSMNLGDFIASVNSTDSTSHSLSPLAIPNRNETNLLLHGNTGLLIPKNASSKLFSVTEKGEHLLLSFDHLPLASIQAFSETGEDENPVYRTVPPSLKAPNVQPIYNLPMWTLILFIAFPVFFLILLLPWVVQKLRTQKKLKFKKRF